ncbi:hypothetical protein ASZ90_008066 [hydrocarbon metagenome]|uniref:Uncharacterized protein n=1 Tax=hydrocarbon metagenome TaxID=938273 RepID=A0A0W8FN15_9ZZZZ
MIVVLPPPEGPIITTMFFFAQENEMSISKYFNFFLKETSILMNALLH